MSAFMPTPGRSCTLVLLLAALATGCAGRGRVFSVPLYRSDMPPDEPPAATVEPDQAYYWVEDDGPLNVSLARAWAAGPASAPVEWRLSLMLEKLPAGSARLYKLDRSSIRLVEAGGGIHRRGLSIRGVAVIEAPRGGRLKGRFHTWIRLQQFTVLTGWAPPINRAPIVIVTGEFEAVENAEAGRRIREATEADDFGRSGGDSLGPDIRWLGSRPAPVTSPGP
jgi:hypothetical protein